MPFLFVEKLQAPSVVRVLARGWEDALTELRWVLSREQVAGAFSEPINLADRSLAFARLQYREQSMVENTIDWRDIPIVSEIKDAPRIHVVKN